MLKKKIALLLTILCLTFALPQSATAGSIILPVPNIQQPPGSNWCWAASVKAIIGYKKGWSPSMSDICYVAYGNRNESQGGDLPHSLNALNYYGVTGTIYDYGLSFPSTETEMIYNRPVFAGLHNGILGHAIVIKGVDDNFNDTGNYAGWYMEPADGLAHVQYWYPLFDIGGVWPSGSYWEWTESIWRIGK